MLEWIIAGVGMLFAAGLGYALGRTVEHIQAERVKIGRALRAHESGAPGFYYYDEQFDDLYDRVQAERRKRGE